MLDLPNRGAIYDIFNIYLAKCFPNQFSSSNPESVSDTPWDMEQWNELIDESTECTPVEIADVVQTCLKEQTFKRGEVLKDLSQKTEKFSRQYSKRFLSP